MGIVFIVICGILLTYICTLLSENKRYENIHNHYKIYKKGPLDSKIYVAKVKIFKWFPIYKWYKADSNNEPKVFNSVSRLKRDLEDSYETYIRNKKEKEDMKKLQRIE
jgi:hypothetical protein